MKTENMERVTSRIKEDAKCRDHIVDKDHHKWIPTDEIATKLVAEYPGLETPWLEQEHVHGVNSIVTGVCKEHKLLVPMNLGNLWRGTTKYGCPECAWEKGYEFEGHSEFNIKRNRPNYIGQSKAEYNLFCAIKPHFPDAVAHHRMQGGKEIDIWIPSIGCGVEYNGAYYHSNVMGKTAEYHREKSRVANRQSKGIFHLFPEEAEDTDRIVRMLALLGKAKQEGHNEWKVAPKAEIGVSVIMSARAKEFHEKWNFISLKDSMLDIHYGLFLGGEMIGVLSGSYQAECICKMSYSKAFFDFPALLKMLNKISGLTLSFVADIRNPLEYGLIDPALNNGLEIGRALPPVAYPLDKGYNIIDRGIYYLYDLLATPDKFCEEEVARTWDCGHIVSYLPGKGPWWAEKLVA